MKLDEFLKKFNVTLSQISERSGIPYQTLYSYQVGRVEPSLTNALKIQEITLGMVSVKDLVVEKK